MAWVKDKRRIAPRTANEWLRTWFVALTTWIFGLMILFSEWDSALMKAYPNLEPFFLLSVVVLFISSLLVWRRCIELAVWGSLLVFIYVVWIFGQISRQ